MFRTPPSRLRISTSANVLADLSRMFLGYSPPAVTVGIYTIVLCARAPIGWSEAERVNPEKVGGDIGPDIAMPVHKQARTRNNVGRGVIMVSHSSAENTSHPNISDATTELLACGLVN